MRTKHSKNNFLKKNRKWKKSEVKKLTTRSKQKWKGHKRKSATRIKGDYEHKIS